VLTLASNVAVDANGGPIVVVRDLEGTPFLEKFRRDGAVLLTGNGPITSRGGADGFVVDMAP